jgi:hypothetical protein
MQRRRNHARRFEHALRTCALAALLVLSAGGTAGAQRALALDPFAPAVDEAAFLAVPGTRTPGAERLSLGLFGWYASNLLEVEVDGERRHAIEDRVGTQWSAEIGLGTRGAVALALPIIAYQDGEQVRDDEAEPSSAALADPKLVGRYRVLGEQADGERVARDGPGLGIEVAATLPMGDDDAWAGEGRSRIEAKLLADFQLLGAGIGAAIGVRHRFEPIDLFNTQLRDEMTFGAGLKVPIPPLHPLVAVAEVRGSTNFKGAATSPVEGDLGARMAFGDVTLTTMVGMGLASGVGAPAFRGVLGLWWMPAPSDSDEDGIDDDEDECRHLPEDHDDFEDDDGCPDPDNDNDLIPDADDLCPNDEALEGRDDDEDGCTDPERPRRK